MCNNVTIVHKERRVITMGDNVYTFLVVLHIYRDSYGLAKLSNKFSWFGPLSCLDPVSCDDTTLQLPL